MEGDCSLARPTARLPSPHHSPKSIASPHHSPRLTDSLQANAPTLSTAGSVYHNEPRAEVRESASQCGRLDEWGELNSLVNGRSTKTQVPLPKRSNVSAYFNRHHSPQLSHSAQSPLSDGSRNLPGSPSLQDPPDSVVGESPEMSHFSGPVDSSRLSDSPNESVASTSADSVRPGSVRSVSEISDTRGDNDVSEPHGAIEVEEEGDSHEDFIAFAHDDHLTLMVKIDMVERIEREQRDIPATESREERVLSEVGEKVVDDVSEAIKLNEPQTEVRRVGDVKEFFEMNELSVLNHHVEMSEAIRIRRISHTSDASPSEVPLVNEVSDMKTTLHELPKTNVFSDDQVSGICLIELGCSPRSHLSHPPEESGHFTDITLQRPHDHLTQSVKACEVAPSVNKELTELDLCKVERHSPNYFQHSINSNQLTSNRSFRFPLTPCLLVYGGVAFIGGLPSCLDIIAIVGWRLFGLIQLANLMSVITLNIFLSNRSMRLRHRLSWFAQSLLYGFPQAYFAYRHLRSTTHQ